MGRRQRLLNHGLQICSPPKMSPNPDSYQLNEKGQHPRKT